MTSKILNRRRRGKILLFFRSQTWKNLLLFLAFAALATVFRVSMSFEENYEEVRRDEDPDDSIIQTAKIAVEKTVNPSKFVAEPKNEKPRLDEETIVLPIHCTGLPSGRRVRFFPSKITLSILVEEGVKHKLKTADFEVSVEYAKLADTVGPVCSPVLTKKPDWVKDFKIQPSIAEFLFE